MNHESLAHVRDAALLRDLAKLVLQERISLAYLLLLIGEVDARHLYAPAGYSSMHAYCVGELRFSDDAAYKRIRAARAARKFPVLFPELAAGRLHLTAVCLLASHLTVENVHELIHASTHRRQQEIEAMLARRLSLPPSPARDRAIVRAMPPLLPVPTPQLAVQPVDCFTNETSFDGRGDNGAAIGVSAECTEPDHPPTPPIQLPPQPEERYLVRLMVEKSVHDKLRYAQTLLSHAVPSGNLAQVLDRALDTLIAALEKRKLGATLPRTSRPR